MHSINRYRLEKLQDELKSAQFEENSWERETKQQEERRELLRKKTAEMQSVVRSRKIQKKKDEVRLEEEEKEEKKRKQRIRRMSVMSVFDQDDDDEDLEELPPEHYAAIAIQRTARRRMASKRVKERRVRFNRAALLVQMMRRKFIAKRYV